MKRLFIQVYLGVMVAAVLGLVVSWVLVRAGYESQRLPDEIAYVELVHPLIVEDLRDAKPEDWPRVLKWWEGVSEFSLRVLSKDDPFWDNHEYLEPPFERLVLAVHTDFRSAYTWAAYAIPDSDQVIYYTYTFDASLLYMLAEILGNVVIFMALGGGIYVLLLPIIRSTQDLTSTVQAYAEGRLDARVRVRGPEPLARLSSQFNQMASQIQQKMQEQKVMTTAISHELKTPLTRLRLALDMALASRDEAERGDMLREMDHDLDDLDALTAELLTLAKLTYSSEALELRPVVVAEIFERLLPKLCDLEPRGSVHALCAPRPQPQSRHRRLWFGSRDSQAKPRGAGRDHSTRGEPDGRSALRDPAPQGVASKPDSRRRSGPLSISRFADLAQSRCTTW